MNAIPLVDLKAQLAEIGPELKEAVIAALERTDYILGAEVSAFERDFAAWVGAEHCVAVANGTDALVLSLRALGVGPGDEVATQANTFVATPLAILAVAAKPVLVDVDPATMQIDLAKLEAAITPRTKALMPVHLFGQIVDMDRVTEIARGRDLAVVEDAAQAHGARWRGRSAGTFGDAAGWSFYPAKNLGAAGDAGAVTTNRAEVADQLRRLRNLGARAKYIHELVGPNSRLDTLQAAILRVKLRHLDEWVERRRAAAARYNRLLGDVPGVELPPECPDEQHCWHLYVVRVSERDIVLRALLEAGIGAGVHYPVPCHLQACLSGLGYRPGDFPVAEKLAGEIISLPLFPEISGQQQERVASVLRAAAAGGRSGPGAGARSRPAGSRASGWSFRGSRS